MLNFSEVVIDPIEEDVLKVPESGIGKRKQDKVSICKELHPRCTRFRFHRGKLCGVRRIIAGTRVPARSHGSSGCSSQSERRAPTELHEHPGKQYGRNRSTE